MSTGLRERELNDAVSQRVYNAVKMRGIEGIEAHKMWATDRIHKTFALGQWKPYSYYDEEAACEAMQRLIAEAPLVISFQADKFYPALKDPDGEYVNLFERIALGTDHREDEGYNVMRDRVESAMFGYDKSGIIGRYANRVRQPLTRLVIADRKPVGLGSVFREWDATNPRFAPSIRPRYATVNYAETTTGIEGWGDSFMELKDHCRQNATYICRDSFKLLEHCDGGMTPGGFRDVKWAIPADRASELVATNHNLYRLLAYMPDNMFKAVLGVVVGKVRTGLTQKKFAKDCGLTKYDYIEMHYHGTLNLHTDLKRIVVNRAEMNREPRAPAVYHWYCFRNSGQKTPLEYAW